MSFLTGFKQMKADALRTNAQLPDGHGVGRSPPGQRFENLARQEYDAQEAAARASAYSYNQYGSNRAPSWRGPAPPKAMQTMMSSMNKELRFEDPDAKALLHQIFNIPVFTEQLFSFPVHSRYQRRTFYGQPSMLIGGFSRAMIKSIGSGGRIQHSDVFDLPPSNEPERIGFRLYQAIDLYKDAWCYNRQQESVPVLAGAETECKARVDEWVEQKKELLKATATAAEMAEASSQVAASTAAATAYHTPFVAPPVQAPPPPVMMPAVEESPAKPLSYPPPLGSQLYPSTASAASAYRTGAGVAGASTGAGPSSAALEAEAEADAAAAAAAAAKAEHERLAAANQSTAKLHEARAEAHRLAAAAISV